MLREAEVAFAHCRRALRGFGPTGSFSLAVLPPIPRDALAALFAFRRDCELIARQDLPVSVRLHDFTRLRVRVHQTFDGYPAGPVLTAVAHTVTAYNLPPGPFIEMIDGFAADMQVAGYRTFDEVNDHCTRVAGTLGALAASVLGIREPGAVAAARDVAVAAQVCAYVRRAWSGNDRPLHIPTSDLAAHGCAAGEVRGWSTPAARAVLSLQVKRVRALLTPAAGLRTRLPQRERIALGLALAGLRGAVAGLQRKAE